MAVSGRANYGGKARRDAGGNLVSTRFRPGASAAQGQIEALARQIADDLIRQREEARRRSQFGKVYQEFDPADDVIRNNVETVTRGLFSGNDGTLVGASEMFTSSLTATQQTYFYDVYHKDPIDSTVEGAEEQFSIAYGHFFGSGSKDLSGNLNDDTPSRAIYKQYAQLLLPPNDKKFTFNGTDSDHIYVINFNRARIREKLDPGNIEFTFLGTPTASLVAATGVPIKIIDDSSTNADSIGEAGLVYNLVSGSINPNTNIYDASSPTYYGLLYPQHGIAIFNADALDANTGGNKPNFQTGVASGENEYNHLRLLSSLKATGGQIQARSSEQVKSSYFFCRLKNAEYNYSNNPSFVTGSLGQLAYNTFIQDPQVYITTVGLYNDRKELLAVAKLSQPLLKSFTREALIKIKLDF